MSNKIVIIFEVTNMLLMEETLKRLGQGFAFTKTSTGLEIQRPYYNISIGKDSISCDSMHQQDVERIKSEYQRDYQVLERSIRGESFEVTETRNEIVILVQ